MGEGLKLDVPKSHPDENKIHPDSLKSGAFRTQAGVQRHISFNMGIRVITVIP